MASRKYNRLNAKDIALLFKQGGIIQSSHLTLRYLITQDRTYAVAVVVSSRAVPGAVQRNRLRRRVSPMVRNQLIKAKDGFKCVFVVKHSELPLSAVLEQEVLTLLEKSGILNK